MEDFPITSFLSFVGISILCALVSVLIAFALLFIALKRSQDLQQTGKIDELATDRAKTIIRIILAFQLLISIVLMGMITAAALNWDIVNSAYIIAFIILFASLFPGGIYIFNKGLFPKY